MSNAAVHGADEPQGPGWWKASDGRYYPPELAPDRPAKKKAVAKKAPAKKATKKPAPTAKSGSEPAKRDGGGSNGSAEGMPRRAGPATVDDQIELRRSQAKQQVKLLAGARQEAALRALASLGGDEGPQLVGVGSRSLDARSGSRVGTSVPGTTPADGGIDPAATTVRSEPEPAVELPPTVSRAAPTRHDPRGPESKTRDDLARTREADGETAPPTDDADDAETAPSAAVVAPTAPQAPPAAGKATGEAPPPAPAVPPQPVGNPVQTPTPMGTEVPFMEVKGSALGADLDRIGEKVLIFADRVELRDRANQPKQVIRYDELAGVEVQKKIMGPTLQVNGASGQSITAKALRPELASGAKAMIEKHADRFRRGGGAGQSTRAATAPTAATATGTALLPEKEVTEPLAPPVPAPDPTAASPTPVSGGPPAPTPIARPPTPHPSVLIGMLEELHSAGVLSEVELEEKRSLIEQRNAL